MIFVLLIEFVPSGKCDTIDVWHVFYNKKKIKEFDEYSAFHEIVIHADSVKKGDSIVVYYYRDTPCDDCPTSLIVEDEQGNVRLKKNGIGTFNPIALSVNDLLVIRKSMDTKSALNIFFSEERLTPKRLLFRLKLQ
ncbi:MAG: hypothetical protein Q8916_14115 [Bacteroidota bacterium]|nr:hypothetical protein [Bacteroidota bacterium]